MIFRKKLGDDKISKTFSFPKVPTNRNMHQNNRFKSNLTQNNFLDKKFSNVDAEGFEGYIRDGCACKAYHSFFLAHI